MTEINKILEFIRSRTMTVIIAVFFGLALLAAAFSLGVMVGYHKAEFSYSWGQNYHMNFGGPRGGFMMNMGRDLGGADYIEANGTFGQVIKTGGQGIVIEGRDSTERDILIDDGTVIRRFHETIPLENIVMGDYIIVIGEPNGSGQIQAKFIRVMPMVSPGTGQGPVMTPNSTQ